jgi:hypothetical protein
LTRNTTSGCAAIVFSAAPFVPHFVTAFVHGEIALDLVVRFAVAVDFLRPQLARRAEVFRRQAAWRVIRCGELPFRVLAEHTVGLVAGAA